MDVLFIKTSSLGDIIHHMPAITDARLHLPDARFTWVVEQPYVPLARMHPAIAEVIPVSSRRWRRAPFSDATWREVRAFGSRLRQKTYDAVIDTQGLLRTGVIARAARGRRHGFDFGSIREPLAGWFYDVRHPIPRDLHAIDRNRELSGFALGYVPSGDPDYGLTRPRIAGGYVVFLHGTARAEKEWPEANWIALGHQLDGAEIVLPHGNEAERVRAEQIASALPNARVAEPMQLDGMADVIGGASLVVGVDTGLLHLAAAFGVPLVGIFAGSAPSLTGPLGQGPVAIVGMEGSAPTVNDVTAAIGRVRSAPQ